MGAELVSTAPSEKGGGVENTPPSLYTDLFYEALPMYIAMGMPADEFWYSDCRMAKAYRDAFKLKQQFMNEKLWLQGAYVYKAIECFAEILPAFPAKGAQVHSYMSEPIPISKTEKNKTDEDANEGAIAFMNMWADKINKHKQGGE